MVHDLCNDIHCWWSDCNMHITWCYASHQYWCAIYYTGWHNTMLGVHCCWTIKMKYYYKGREPYIIKRLVHTHCSILPLSLSYTLDAIYMSLFPCLLNTYETLNALQYLDIIILLVPSPMPSHITIWGSMGEGTCYYCCTHEEVVEHVHCSHSLAIARQFFQLVFLDWWLI